MQEFFFILNRMARFSDLAKGQVAHGYYAE